MKLFWVVKRFLDICLIKQRVRSELEKEGLTTEDLENANYKNAYAKLQVEEALLEMSETSILTPRDNMTTAGYESRIQRRDSDYDDDYGYDD